MTALKLFSVALFCLLAVGCSIEPPLHLRMRADTDIVLDAKVDVDFMWQTDWEAHWTFDWDESVYGPVGYTLPARMRVHLYPLDATGNIKSHIVNNFYGTSAVIPITVGMYDMLFHNNDSEVLLFEDGETPNDIRCTTRIISNGIKSSQPVMTLEQKAETKAEDRTLVDTPVALMPDDLFTLYDRNRFISDNLEDYEYIDGRYVLRIEGRLSPATYIYLFQLNLVHNGERVTGSEGGAALTGLAAGVDLRTSLTDTAKVSVPTVVHFNPKTDQMAVRMMTFGIPGCNPYDEASVSASESTHFLVVNVCYYNGTWKNIRIDVTDALRALPLGGVIDLELDVDDFPPDGGHSGGGFDAIIDNWQDVVGGTTIIQ